MAAGESGSVGEHSRALSELGAAIAGMGFSYKVRYESGREYWEKRVDQHERYFAKSAEYYGRAYQMMGLIDGGQAGAFLPMLERFHKLRARQMGVLEKIRQRPGIMERGARQQSRWSRDARDEIIDSSNECLEHERVMSRFLREFYGRHPGDAPAG